MPKPIRLLARKNFKLLKSNSRHPSLRLKKVGELWSARVGIDHRAVALESDDGLTWVWIGTHAEYDKLLD
ncbi:hypothetical protein [Mesorhizobium sp. IMUNJ 23232]|uniref:hypothetical protein n=1 Tax=Mesorhizobium sp. IMUNJ 23232 TaxID=3376064 RepID=UPI0037CAFA2B